MTDQITPESLRAHADRLEELGFAHSAKALRQDADRLDAAQARDTEAEKLAGVIYAAEAEHGNSNGLICQEWSDRGPIYREASIAGARAALDHLEEQGRLVPSGAQVITEAEAADVRTLSLPTESVAEYAAASARLRARFAPAEPAEEPERAERDSDGIIRINGGRIVALSRDTRKDVQRWFDVAKPGSRFQRDYRLALDLFDREEASAPAEPAAKREPQTCGPWDRWQDVPDGVKYRGTHRNGSATESRWVNRGGVCHWFDDTKGVEGVETYREVNSVSPMVRVEVVGDAE